jgi:hypothetical protein
MLIRNFFCTISLSIWFSLVNTQSVTAAEYKCHAFCSTPLIMADMNILNSVQIPHFFSSGKDIESAFDALVKICKKVTPVNTAVPLRFLHAPTTAQNLVKVVLVPALSGDVCAPSY